MPACTAACTTGIVIPSLAQMCDVQLRSECPSKLVLITCSTAITSGSDAAKAAAIVALLASGDMGATGRLKNFVWADPQTTDFATNDCSPATPLVTGRELTFEDFNAIDVEDDGTTASPYYDRDFWNDVVAAGQKFYVGWTTCEGLLYLAAVDRAYTTPMTAILTVFTSFDKSLPNQCNEVKKGTVRFTGDPLRYFPKPYLDLSTVVGANPTLAALY